MKRATVRQQAKPADTYRQALLAKRAEVLSSLGLKVDSIASIGRVGEEDQAQASLEEFISLRLSSLDYEKLRLVDEALDRLDSGDFGVCLGCEQLIPAKRLLAIPWAKYCVRCQDQLANLHFEENEGAWIQASLGSPF